MRTSKLLTILEHTVEALYKIRKDAGKKGVRRNKEEVTVLAAQNDPYRVGTPDDHIEGSWLQVALDTLGIDTLHFRGVHYKLLGYIKPDGTPYTNDDKTWKWLQSGPGKAARWLRYIPFDRIRDGRNDEPTLIVRDHSLPSSDTDNGMEPVLPQYADLMPTVLVDDYNGAQRYRYVFFGEKSSLYPILRPLADEYGADLLLPTGELSDTMIYHMARHANHDGRHTICFYVSDCDPSGWQMSISLSRKIQAFKDLLFPDLSMEVRRVALTPTQVLTHVNADGSTLPSTPLKEGEARAEAWEDAMGVEQTEIDAVDAGDLEDWLREAIDPWFDPDLDQRVADAEEAWRSDAQDALEDAIGADKIDKLRERVDKFLADTQRRWESLNEASQKLIDKVTLDLPDFDVPCPDLDEAMIAIQEEPLYHSDWSYVAGKLDGFYEGSRKLKRSKSYERTV